MGTASAASLQSNVPASGRQLGAMGYVIPGVLPAGLTRLGNRVVGLVGDAAFLTGSSDFVTICQLELPVAIAVHTFRHIGTINATLMEKFGRSYAIDIGKVDIARYAAAFAATGIRVDEPPEVDDAWSAALTADGPVLFDLRAGHTFPRCGPSNASSSKCIATGGLRLTFLIRNVHAIARVSVGRC